MARVRDLLESERELQEANGLQEAVLDRYADRWEAAWREEAQVAPL